MPKETPKQFAKYLAAELADIHAVVRNIHDYVIQDISERTGRPKSEVAEKLNAKRKKRSDETWEKFLKIVDLE